MTFKEKIQSGKFLVTSEIGPPKGTQTLPLLEDAELIRNRVDAINVTDLQSSVMRLGSLAVCSLLKQKGFEPIFQVTCRDRNRLALQSDLLSVAALGMEKKIEAGAEFFQTQAVYDIKSFENFLSKIKHLKTTILAGIVLLKSAGMAKYMNENVAGVNVPQDLIDEMAAASKEDRGKKSVEIAGRLIKELKPLCQGIHIMPIGWDKKVPLVIEAGDI
jgi:5,10-methylenetetrahydrofolate reductase